MRDIRIAGDTHTHTVACGHAMGTITENAAYAARQGHRFIAMTEHCCTMPYAPSLWFFNNMLRNLGDEIDGIVIVKGVEANVVNIDADVDMPEEFLRRLQWVVASVHFEDFAHGDFSRADYTDMYCRLAANPLVDVIGHSGDPRFAHDHERVVKAYKQYDKIVEVNSASPKSRAGAQAECRDIVACCKRYGVKITLGSDAHCPQSVGNFAESLAMLDELDFPEELIVNADYGRFRGEVFARHGVWLPE